MKIIVLGSGSKGNATYIEHNDIHILIDDGLSFRQIKQRMEEKNLELKKIDAVLITHEHIDHTSGLGVLLGKYNSKVYMTEKTHLGACMSVFDMLRGKDIVYINAFIPFNIDDLVITPLPLFHDSKDCVGFLIEESGNQLVYITDTGYIHNKLLTYIQNANMYIIEANHDPKMLMDSTRPLELKQRIIGDRGHLSNQDCAATLCYSIGPKTKNIIFAHMSEECNTIEIAKKTIYEVFGEFEIETGNYNIEFATQNTATEVYEI